MQIGVKAVHGCIACGQCRVKQLGRCVFDDDVCNRIVEKLDDAEALIVGSPVYYGKPDYPEREEWQPMHFIRLNNCILSLLSIPHFVLLITDCVRT